MELFKKVTNIDFMGLRLGTAILSSILFLASILSLYFNGLNWGLDFTGGTQIQISFQQPVDIPQIRTELAQTGFQEIVVQSYGTTKDVLISVAPHKNINQQQLATQILKVLPGATLKQVEFVGPQVGQELANKGAMAVLIALLGTMFYIAIRFEYRFAIGAAVALIHDPILILGIFSFWQVDFDITALVAVLTVIGYSLNDTIVVFDRIRELTKKHHSVPTVTLINAAVLETMSRSINNSVTIILMLLSLSLLGGESIRWFAVALLIGSVTGTYSSTFTAVPLLLVWDDVVAWRKRRR